jgi:hypothetical protein
MFSLAPDLLPLSVAVVNTMKELLDIHDKEAMESTRNNGVRTDLTPLIFFGIITLTNEIERSHTNINFIKFNTE